MKNYYFAKLGIAFSFLALSPMLNAQQTYTFTTGGATGNIGPDQTAIDAAYTGTSLDGDVTVVGGIQYWEVPTTGSYSIEAFGGQGYGSFGGRGAQIYGEFNLVAGDTLKILVGQMGGHYLNYPSTTYNHQYGGGGGSFITYTDNTPLIVAGGGGGNHGAVYVASCDGQITMNGASGANASTIGAGGTGGMGGQQAISADGGGGLLGNGNGLAGGQAFVNGGLGGIDEGTGGFGCGGGTSSWNNYRGGGGGGYSGGGGGNNGSSCCPAGGGGGSYNAGIMQEAYAGIQTGDGLVIITPLTKVPNDAGISQIAGFVAPVCKGTYPVDVMINNFGNNSINPVTVQWTVNGVAQTDYTYNSDLDTTGGAGPDTAWVTLGNVSITEATTITVWTHMPNNVADTNNLNDTLVLYIAAPAVVDAVMTEASCNGLSDGSIVSTASGGTPGYTTYWSTGDSTTSITGLAMGSYTVYIEDMDGCTDSLEVQVTQPSVLTSMVFATDISCNGMDDGEIILSPQGGTPGYTSTWSTGDTTSYMGSLTAGTYTFTVIDFNGCTYTDSVTISEPAAIALSATMTQETTAGNDGTVDLTISGGTGPFTQLWSNGAGTEDLSGLAGGIYTVTVTDANGCTETLDVEVWSALALNELENAALVIYPNPSIDGNFHVSSDIEIVGIEVFDAVGRMVALPVNVANGDVDGTQLATGNYTVRVTTTQAILTKTLVILK